jgi:hypothetical protein
VADTSAAAQPAINSSSAPVTANGGLHDGSSGSDDSESSEEEESSSEEESGEQGGEATQVATIVSDVIDVPMHVVHPVQQQCW